MNPSHKHTAGPNAAQTTGPGDAVDQRQAAAVLRNAFARVRESMATRHKIHPLIKIGFCRHRIQRHDPRRLAGSLDPLQ